MLVGYRTSEGRTAAAAVVSLPVEHVLAARYAHMQAKVQQQA